MEQVYLLLTYISVSTAFVPNGKRYFIDGDLLLGGLFDIHSNFQDGKCTDIQREYGIHAIEAMGFSIDEINKKGILSNITLGMVGVDTCGSETVSLDNTLELIDMRINKKAKDGSCSSNDMLNGRLIGVIGPAVSRLSIPVASLSRLFNISQISYQSTSPELSDKSRFKYFKRTVPSDNHQACAIAAILKEMRYHYITIVYEDSSYGINLKSELEKLSKKGDFCIGTSIKLPYEQTETENNNTIETLLKYRNTNGYVVVVLIILPHTASSLFRSINHANVGKNFRWVATDAWAGRSVIKSDIEKVVEGSIGVQLLMGKIPGFQHYFEGLKRKPRNPWWNEYNKNNTHMLPGFEEFGVLHYINNAVLAFAHAVKELHRKKCYPKTRLCDDLKESLATGSDLLDALGEVKFVFNASVSEGSRVEIFEFLNGSEGPPRYSILRYTVNNRTGWEEIGTYSDLGSEKEIHIDKQKTELYRQMPSYCSKPCPFGYAVIKSEKTCCWTCTKCLSNQYVSSLGCIPCPHGYRSNAKKDNCSVMNVESMSFHKPVAIATLTLSSVGVAVCVFVILILLINRETPIVKAIDLNPSFLLIFGLIMSYSSSAVFLAKPTPVLCGLTRCFLGLCYTLQYATLLTKTIRIYRLFQARTVEKKKFINSRSSITMTLLLTFMHALGITAWIIFDRPRIQVQYDDVKGVIICSDVQNFSYAGCLIYPVLLLAACVVFAVKTRKIPHGFKETRFISICSYTTCIVWLGFASTFFFTHNNTVRVLALCLTLSINSTVTLCVLFLSRVYVIITKPKLNTREHVMNRNNEKTERSSTYFTVNKSVGTDGSNEDYEYINYGLLTAMSVSAPNLVPFSSDRKFLSNSFSMDNIQVVNDLADVKIRSKKNYQHTTIDIPRITINDNDPEF